MKIKPADTAPISKPVEAAAPAKAAEPVRQEAAPDSAPPQLSREESAERSKARDTTARAQFAQRTDGLEGRPAAIEGGDLVAQVSPRDQVKQARKLLDKIAKDPEGQAADAIEVARKLDRLGEAIGGIDTNQMLDVLSDLNSLGMEVQNAQTQVQSKLDFGDGGQRAGLEHLMEKLRDFDQAVSKAGH